MKKQRILLVGIISVGVIALLILFGWLFRKPLYRLSLGDIDARYRSAMLAYQEHRYADARKELAPLARLDTAKCAQFLLGDLLYHGPRNPLPEGYEPPAVAKLLNVLMPMVVGWMLTSLGATSIFVAISAIAIASMLIVGFFGAETAQKSVG